MMDWPSATDDRQMVVAWRGLGRCRLSCGSESSRDPFLRAKKAQAQRQSFFFLNKHENMLFHFILAKNLLFKVFGITLSFFYPLSFLLIINPNRGGVNGGEMGGSTIFSFRKVLAFEEIFGDPSKTFVSSRFSQNGNFNRSL
jgi:hypothetical protein